MKSGKIWKLLENLLNDMGRKRLKRIHDLVIILNFSVFALLITLLTAVPGKSK